MPKLQQEIPSDTKRIDELESIRGLAALIVVFFHIPKWNHFLDIGIINNGYLMVELFFVLSGFVMFNAYAEKIATKKDLIRFQFLRFGRLYPLHLLFLGAFIFIEAAKYFAQLKLGISSPNTEPFRENNLTAIVQHVFLVQAIGPGGNPITFNVPAWSISVEFLTYLIFGASILLVRKIKDTVFFLFAIISLLMLLTQITFGFDDLIHCLAGFFIGCLTASATKRLSIACPNYISPVILTAILAFLHIKTSRDYDLAIYFLTSALIISLVLSKGGVLKKILNFKVLTWLGSISYAVYMSHAAILWVANQTIRVILKRPEIMIGDVSTPQLSKTDTLIAWVLITAIVLVCSTLVHRFIEKPYRDRSRRYAYSKLN